MVEVEYKDAKETRWLIERNTRGREDGHYVVQLLWKQTKINLPDFRGMARSRLTKFDRKIMNTNQWDNINKMIREYHKKIIWKR